MLEDLDDQTFAELEDAYGPAVDVPALLRAVASDELELARQALESLAAGIFHQGSYFSATAPAIPFLLELAATPIPARADLILFLADMSGTTSELELAYQPYLFQSTPGLPDYPEAVATIDAIRAGHACFVAALAAEDPKVRACAAYALAILGLANPWTDSLAHEPDPNVQITLAFALARLGHPPALDQREGLVGDVIDGLRFADEPERGLAALARLLLLEHPLERVTMPFYEGDLVRFAAQVLVDRAGDPRAFALADAALSARLARGERIQDPPRGPSMRICDEPDASTDAWDYFADLPLRTIANAMASLAFGQRLRDPELLRRSDLDDRQRRVLALTRDHAIPIAIAGAPWIEPEAMARFLAGGGPLDQTLDWRGSSQPLFVVLATLARSPDATAAESEVDAIFAELARTWPPERLLELAIDILDNGYGLAPYGPPLAVLSSAWTHHVEPLARRDVELRQAYAERLLEREYPLGVQARFAFITQIEANQPVDPRFDRVAAAAIAADLEGGLAWLASFPEPRRSSMVARFGNAWIHRRLGSVCEPELLEAALIAGFLDPACAWLEHEVETLLQTIADTSKLEALLAETRGRRRSVLARVLQARTREGVFTLEMWVEGEGVRALVRDGQGTLLIETMLSSSPRVDELAGVLERCSNTPATTIELAGDLDSTTEYRVMRLLGDAGFRGRVQAAGGSTMTRMTRA